MTKLQSSLIIIGFVLMTLLATNPSIGDHQYALYDKVNTINWDENKDFEGFWNNYRKENDQFNKYISIRDIRNFIRVKRDNFYLFSFAKMAPGDVSFDSYNYCSFGILGMIFFNKEGGYPLNEVPAIDSGYFQPTVR